MSGKRKGSRIGDGARRRSGFWEGVGVLGLALIAILFWKNTTKQNEKAAPPPSFRLESEREVFAQYAGSESCRDCHKQAFDLWLPSNHCRAERPITSEDEDAFSNRPAFFHGGIQTQPLHQGDHFAIRTLALDGQKKTFKIDRVFGNEPLRQFLVSHIGGRKQAMDAAFDPHLNEWFSVFGDEDRRPGEWGHWTGRGMNWNSMCATCHNTRLRKNYDPRKDAFQTTMAEMSVGCEACHGPMKKHVLWQRQHNELQHEESNADPTIVHFTRAQILDTCGSCHSRRSELTGDFHPGESFLDHHYLSIPDASNVFYADGQVRDENYVFTSFLSSRMHASGVHCLDCHEAHSTRTRLPGNALCMRCHNGSVPNSPKIIPASHSHHLPQSSGNECVNCHMPQTTYMERHKRRDHGFTIPDPFLTKHFDIPNACNRCHEDRDVDWALAATEAWYGERMDRYTRHRAEWFARARQGNEDARDPLIRLIHGKDLPIWKAGAAHLLSQWLPEKEVRQALLTTLNHSNALVRAHGIIAISPLMDVDHEVQNAFENLLDDPSRNVRLRAAWALRSQIDLQNRTGQELEHFLNHNSDQPIGQMQWGAFFLARENLAKALQHYTKAVEWDAHSAGIRHELAVILSMLGRDSEALEELKKACHLAPEDAEYRYKLALVWNALGNKKETLLALKKAVELNPRHGRAWYNLGLALHQNGDIESAIHALVRAESTLPNDPDIPYARATLLIQSGRKVEAEIAVRRALTLAPHYTDARNLLNTLQR